MQLPSTIKKLSFIAVMAALAFVLSFPPFLIPLAPRTYIHFTQLPIFIGGILAGPTAGLMTGAIGGLSMSFFVGPAIPFIFGGLAILGCASGFFAKRVRPLFAGILAWLIQAPYTIVTDYVWFTSFKQNSTQASLMLIASIMATLTIEVLISSALTEVIISYLKKTHVTL